MRCVYNNGRRKGAGYKGDAGDCVARAIASGLPNKQVYQRLGEGVGSRRKSTANVMGQVAGNGISAKRK